MPDDSELTMQNGSDRDLRPVWEFARPLLISLTCTAVALALFTWLSEEVFEGEMQKFDAAVRMKVHEYFSPSHTEFMKAMTFLGSISFLTALFAVIVAYWLWRGMKRPATWLAIAVGGSVVLDISLKLSFHRQRPVPFVGNVPMTYSFPSGHALSSFCFYGVLAGLICKRIENPAARVFVWTLATTLVLAIGLSRIYLGVHYPTDVLAGYIAAAAWVSSLLVAVYSHRHVRERNQTA